MIWKQLSLPAKTLFVGTALVAASTAVLPWITGYGTELYQVVVLGAWSIVAALTSSTVADQHHGPVWFVALLFNIALFLLPGLAIFYIGRKRWPWLGALGLSAWAVFYLLALFVLFPAMDGP